MSNAPENGKKDCIASGFIAGLHHHEHARACHTTENLLPLDILRLAIQNNHQKIFLATLQEYFFRVDSDLSNTDSEDHEKALQLLQIEKTSWSATFITLVTMYQQHRRDQIRLSHQMSGNRTAFIDISLGLRGIQVQTPDDQPSFNVSSTR
jgi:hypothetical protein